MEFRRARKRGLQQGHEWLADLCFEGEMELTSGNAEVGRSLLAVVVQAGSGNDLLDATAMIARAVGRTRLRQGPLPVGPAESQATKSPHCWRLLSFCNMVGGTGIEPVTLAV